MGREHPRELRGDLLERPCFQWSVLRLAVECAAEPSPGRVVATVSAEDRERNMCEHVSLRCPDRPECFGELELLDKPRDIPDAGVARRDEPLRRDCLEWCG